MGWHPGALGYRFTFEAKTENVGRYMKNKVGPQAYLLYLEHLTATNSKKDAAQKNSTQKFARENELSSDSSSAEENDRRGINGGPMRRRHGDARHRERRVDRGLSSQGTEQSVRVMLPPLLPIKAS